MNTLAAEKTFIRETFAEIHDLHGYGLTEEQAPYPCPDPSVLFVGAQISLWKPRLGAIASGKEDPSYCTQKCIRLQNKDHFFDGAPIVFNSVFRTHGAIGPADSFGGMVSVVEEFLSAIGVDDERVLVKTDEHLAQSFDTTRTVLVDSERPEYYEWTYGEDGLVGRGITFAIRSEKDAGHFDIGNVIIIFKDGTPIVSEWGFGVETLINAIHSDTLPIRYADMPETFREQLVDMTKIKYTDALIACVRIAEHDVKVTERGAGRALHDYVRGSAYLASRIGKGVVAVTGDISRLAYHFELPDDNTKDIEDKIQYYIGRINFLKKYFRQNRGCESMIVDQVCRQSGIPNTLGRLLLN